MSKYNTESNNLVDNLGVSEEQNAKVSEVMKRMDESADKADFEGYSRHFIGAFEDEDLTVEAKLLLAYQVGYIQGWNSCSMEYQQRMMAGLAQQSAGGRGN